MYIPQGDPRETFPENPSSMISCFPTPKFGPQKVPGPKCRPEGSRIGPWTQTPKRCAPKNGAEPHRNQFKRSHEVQVMAENHFSGNSVIWAGL